MFANIFDSHTHSENSQDGHDSLVKMAHSAISAGVKGFTVTDHCDCEIMESMRYRSRIAKSELDTRKAHEVFQGTVDIRFGVELSDVFFDLDAAFEMLSKHSYDFVLGSIHRIEGYPAFFDTNYAGMTDKEIDSMMRDYFMEQVRFVRWGHIDSLAHIAVPLRYLKVYRNLEVDLKQYTEEIDALLRALVETGVGLELNVAGVRTALGQCMPTLWILKRYRELGGELVTIGSDAHLADKIGSCFQQGMELLVEAGFSHYAFFRERKPESIRIA